MAINGIIGGMFWILTSAAMTFYASRLLIECSEITGKSGYEKLAKLAFGKRWKTLVAVSQIITMLGFVVTYLTIVSTLLYLSLSK
jgi:amino acid permease